MRATLARHTVARSNMDRLRNPTVRNRRVKRSGSTRDLVLRHRAALERLEDPGPLQPACPAPIPLRLEDDLPVVDGSALDAAVARHAISQHGSLVVRELIPERDVGRLASVIDRVLGSFDAVTEQGAPHDEWFSPFPGRGATVDATRAWLRTKGGVLVGDSPGAALEIADVFTTHGIDRLAEQYLGQPPILSIDKWTIRRSIVENGIEWHQDGAFLGSEVRALNVWLALSECGVDAPSLDVVPRLLDEIVAPGTDEAGYSWSVGHDAAIRAAGTDGWRRPRFGPGDALLFDEKLLHRTGVSSEMTQPRYAIETWFFAPAGDTTSVEVPLVL